MNKNLIPLRSRSPLSINPLTGEIYETKNNQTLLVALKYLETTTTDEPTVISRGLVNMNSLSIEGHMHEAGQVADFNYRDFSISEISADEELLEDFVMDYCLLSKDPLYQLPLLSDLGVNYLEEKHTGADNYEALLNINAYLLTAHIDWRYIFLSEKDNKEATCRGLCVLEHSAGEGLNSRVLSLESDQWSLADFKGANLFRRILFASTTSRIDKSSFMSLSMIDFYNSFSDAKEMFSGKHTKDGNSHQIKRSELSTVLGVTPDTLYKLDKKIEKGNRKAKDKMSDYVGLYCHKQFFEPVLQTPFILEHEVGGMKDIAHLPKTVLAFDEVYRRHRWSVNKMTRDREVLVFLQNDNFSLPFIVSVGSRKRNEALFRTIMGADTQKIDISTMGELAAFSEKVVWGEKAIFISLSTDGMLDDKEVGDFLMDVLEKRMEKEIAGERK